MNFTAGAAFCFAARFFVMEDVREIVKQYVLQELLPGEDPANLTDSVHLIRDGILDSLATLKLVSFLEERFKIQLAAHEANPANLDSLSDIAALVERKQKVS
jgi:acyl carrier protein